MALSCHAMPCHAMPCHAMPCHNTASSLDLAILRFFNPGFFLLLKKKERKGFGKHLRKIF